MNPIITCVLFTLIYQENNNFPNHFDTFKLEQLLDKLNYTVNSLDRINHLNEIAHEPLVKGNLTHTIEDSIHTAKPLFREGKPKQQLDTIESVLESLKKLGGLQNMAQNLGPMLNAISDIPSSSLPENNNTDTNNSTYNQITEKEDPYL